MSIITNKWLMGMLLSSSFALCAAPEPQQKLSLEDCIRIAMEKHQSLSVSNANVAIAEAQYQQAMSAYWPSIAAQVNAQRADQDRTFTMQGQFNLPPTVGGAVAALAPNPSAAQAIQQGLAQPRLSKFSNFGYIFVSGLWI